jgi:hypothetical protein
VIRISSVLYDHTDTQLGRQLDSRSIRFLVQENDHLSRSPEWLEILVFKYLAQGSPKRSLYAHMATGYFYLSDVGAALPLKRDINEVFLEIPTPNVLKLQIPFKSDLEVLVARENLLPASFEEVGESPALRIETLAFLSRARVWFWGPTDLPTN